MGSVRVADKWASVLESVTQMPAHLITFLGDSKIHEPLHIEMERENESMMEKEIERHN